jgi:hypothetical protein
MYTPRTSVEAIPNASIHHSALQNRDFGHTYDRSCALVRALGSSKAANVACLAIFDLSCLPRTPAPHARSDSRRSSHGYAAVRRQRQPASTQRVQLSLWLWPRHGAAERARIHGSNPMEDLHHVQPWRS